MCIGAAKTNKRTFNSTPSFFARHSFCSVSIYLGTYQGNHQTSIRMILAEPIDGDHSCSHTSARPKRWRQSDAASLNIPPLLRKAQLAPLLKSTFIGQFILIQLLLHHFQCSHYFMPSSTCPLILNSIHLSKKLTWQMLTCFGFMHTAVAFPCENQAICNAAYLTW